MEQQIISSVRFLGALPMFAAAVCLLVFNRAGQQSAVYNRSRRLITAATLILGLQFATQFIGHLREQSPTLCWTVNMTAFVIATPLYNMAELNLLRAGHNMRERYRSNAIFAALCYAILAIGYFTDTLVNDQQPWLTATFVVAILYFVKLLELSWTLGREMRVTDTRLTDEELAQRHDALRFTARVMNWIILFSLFSLFSPWVGMSPSLMINSLYGVVIFLLLLLFIGLLIVYGWNMAECMKVDNEIAEAVKTEAATENALTRQRIEQWVSERRFTDPDTTITSALEAMGVSATALNFYLEQHTAVDNYRQWLPYLRIEEAKRIMQEHPEPVGNHRSAIRG